ncbi:uncharacterized protein LOC130642423 [Hydractinia symbiolongicarpus]|uniref:uncharacterized protein LOC130642423 n=1 Tax=Hydractinia symbiolongicarpus TaxID=13093 RepID=UPI0025512CB2|nr:uncharacterized protein LOC130642423 [Hydractinia symbiolongicarpus]
MVDKRMASPYQKIMPQTNEVVWVHQRYTPTELRGTAPVPRFKFIIPSKLPPVPEAWKKPVSPPTHLFERRKEEQTLYKFSPSTRCEEWSTLRQILPSKGRPVKTLPPRWGTAQSEPIKFVSKKEVRFPIINSPMTKYVDDMHVTNRLFKLH